MNQGTLCFLLKAMQGRPWKTPKNFIVKAHLKPIITESSFGNKRNDELRTNVLLGMFLVLWDFTPFYLQEQYLPLGAAIFQNLR